MTRAPMLLLVVVLGGCASRPAETSAPALDRGYLLGRADAVKRLYWAKQALEAPERHAPPGELEYLTYAAPEPADGRRLAPAKEAVPVFIAAPQAGTPP